MTLGVKDKVGLVYILLLAGKYWYVGWTKTVDDFLARMRQESLGKSKAAKWVRIHPVLVVVAVWPYVDQSMEQKKTDELVEKYGTEYVRGGNYCGLEDLGTLEPLFLDDDAEEVEQLCAQCENHCCATDQVYVSLC